MYQCGCKCTRAVASLGFRESECTSNSNMIVSLTLHRFTKHSSRKLEKVLASVHYINIRSLSYLQKSGFSDQSFGAFRAKIFLLKFSKFRGLGEFRVEQYSFVASGSFFGFQNFGV